MMVRQMHQARVVSGTSAAPDQADSCDHAVKCQTAMIELRVLLLLIHRSSVLTSGTANACGWICARVCSSERQFRAERNLGSPKVTFFFRTWMQTPITSRETCHLVASFDPEAHDSTAALHEDVHERLAYTMCA